MTNGEWRFADNVGAAQLTRRTFGGHDGCASAGGRKAEMRVLLTAFGSRGDVQPMLALGLGLRDRGHDVAVGAAPNYRARVEELGLTFREIGGDFEPWLKGQSTRNRRSRASA